MHKNNITECFKIILLWISTMYICKCLSYAPNIYGILSLKLPDVIYLKSLTHMIPRVFSGNFSHHLYNPGQIILTLWDSTALSKKWG